MQLSVKCRPSMQQAQSSICSTEEKFILFFKKCVKIQGKRKWFPMITKSALTLIPEKDASAINKLGQQV